MPKTFTWLHLSDLHMGVTTQEWLWPTFKHELFDDLARIYDQTGALDAVIFSGDLTQSATTSQFSNLDIALEELSQQFASRGFQPTFVFVPGNHDLQRPKPEELSVLLLRRWWQEPAVQRGFWLPEQNAYQKTISEMFASYSNWHKRPRNGINIPKNICHGIIPGDFAASIDTPSGRVGVVGLNSAWLQLDGSDYKGRLLVHPKQINAVTNDDPVAWCRAHVFNILVTHHPEDWQHPESASSWKSDINPPGRFDLHLFGHMHTPDATSHGHGGGVLQRSVQAASIFGLETYGDRAERIHGYSIGQTTTSGGRQIRIWPRRLITKNAGDRKLVADLTLCSDGEDSFVFPGAVVSAIPSNVDSHSPRSEFPVLAPVFLDSASNAEGILSKVRRHMPRQAASLKVRGVEQTLCRAALSEVRAVWIGAEWGSGFEGFVGALQNDEESGTIKTYRIDASEYFGRDSFFAAIKERFDFSFEAFCEALSSVGRAYLILDDVPTQHYLDGQQTTVSEDLEFLISVMLQYCPELRVIMHTRQVPAKAIFPAVSLKALDEADLRTYVSEHPNGGGQFANADAIAMLFRHTDGVPARVDTALRELEIITIDQLASVNHDLARIDIVSEDIPEAMAKAVADISTPDDPMKRRAYDLLQALSGFPRGETLERIKRFNGPYPFFPAHARELIDRSLLLTTSIEGETLGGDEPAKLLSVPRPVRDYIRSKIPPEDLSVQNRRAASLYFGEKWTEGHIRPSIAERFKNHVCSTAELTNATAIIVRLVNDGIVLDDDRAKAAALRIADTFVSTVFSGDHYTTVLTICGDILREIGDIEDESATRIRIAYAKSLRMLSKSAAARDLLTSLSELPGPKAQRNSILLNLALAHQALDESDKAVAVAQLILKSDKTSNSGLQARSIILEESADDDSRSRKLLEHEAYCRRHGAYVVANNLAIDRIEDLDEISEDVDAALEVVLKSSLKENDFYTVARTITKKVALETSGDRVVSDKDKALLISAYQFLFSERITTLFHDCHDALWSLFERERDIRNLLRLFRHSSLIWRLRGQEGSERRYAERLVGNVLETSSENVRTLDRETAYYQVRVTVLLPTSSPSAE